MPRDNTAAHQLRAAGARPLLIAQHEQEVSAQLTAEHDAHMLAIGRHLVGRGLADEWVDIFRIAYPDATTTDPISFLQTGGQFT